MPVTDRNVCSTLEECGGRGCTRTVTDAVKTGLGIGDLPHIRYTRFPSDSGSWGVAPGWYGAAPLALKAMVFPFVPLCLSLVPSALCLVPLFKHKTGGGIGLQVEDQLAGGEFHWFASLFSAQVDGGGGGELAGDGDGQFAGDAGLFPDAEDGAFAVGVWPKAVTRVPGRETAMPACSFGNLPAGVVTVAVWTG